MALRPELIEVYEYVRWQPEWVSRKQVAEALDISYGAARYRLWKLARLGWLREFTTWPPRRIFYGLRPVKPPPPPPPPPPLDEELIGDEEVTGLTIYYHTKKRKYMVRHPETAELVRVEDTLLIETTASLATDVGHDVPVNLEITAITTVTETSASEVFRITKENGPIELALILWMKQDLKFGALARAVDTIDHAFMGQSQEGTRGYPCPAPAYPTLGAWVERRSRYIGFRKYPKAGCDHIQAE